MSVIKFDDQINVQVTKTFQFKDKTYSVKLNDHTNDIINDFLVKMTKLADKYSDAIDDGNAKEIKKTYGALKDCCIQAFDSVLGVGAGKFLYKEYGENTDNLGQIFRWLQNQITETMKAKKEQEDTKDYQKSDR